MSKREAFQGSLPKMLTVMFDGLHEDKILEIIERMSIHVPQEILLGIIDDSYAHLNLVEQAVVIDSAIPTNMEQVKLDPMLFGDNREIVEQIQQTVRDSDYDAVESSDALVHTEMLRPSIFRPVYLNQILILYQKWSHRWHQKNPENNPPESDSGSASSSRSRSPADMGLPSLFREHSEPADRSRDGSRENSRPPSRAPSRAPSRPPSRDSRDGRDRQSSARRSTLSDLLHQMKMMC
jgi:hypothetical protein